MMDNPRFKEGTPYVANNADLLQNLEGQEGYFEVIHGNQVFTIKCEQIEGHSPVLESFIPTGKREFWLITKLSPVAAESYGERTRSATVGSQR